MKPINSLFFLTVLLISASLFSQKTPTLEPIIGKAYNFQFSQERQELWATCDSLMFSKAFKEKLTQQEFSTLIDKCGEIGYSEACDDLWSVICGNDWTDEGYNITYYMNNPDFKFTTASSALKSTSENTYGNRNISDLSYQTAWIEGVKGYGIGETVAFKFPPGHPRITKVIIANGYIKDKNTWKNNSRVKQLKMYVNNKPFAILNLKDVYAEQAFKIPTIGYERGVILDKKDNVQPDSIKFEILSVYKGDKYKDTAITEIYFDGLDVY